MGGCRVNLVSFVSKTEGDSASLNSSHDGFSVGSRDDIARNPANVNAPKPGAEYSQVRLTLKARPRYARGEIGSKRSICSLFSYLREILSACEGES